MPFGVQIEKDPQIQQMLTSVFDRLSEIQNELEPQLPDTASTEIKFVSFENALKELLTQKQA